MALIRLCGAVRLNGFICVCSEVGLDGLIFLHVCRYVLSLFVYALHFEVGARWF